MERVLVIDPSECTGCHICETMCSLYHEQEVNPEKSRIRIITLEEEGNLIDIPINCMMCEDAPCQAICPTNAIYTSTTGAKLTNPDKCIGCNACVFACPFGATYVDRNKGIAVMCDLCDGDPLCVKFCPAGCLQFLKPEEVSIRLRRSRMNEFLKFLKMTTTMTPEEG
ncbi:Thiosulfate reductase electron transfer subunit PhsB [subsurface metagenome]